MTDSRTAPLGHHYQRELREQPDVLRQLLAVGRPPVETVAAHLRAAPPRFVVCAARGSSGNAAHYAQILFGVRQGLAVALAAPSVFTRYGAAPNLRDSLAIGISQSGKSPDVVSVIESATHQGALTVALTNDGASPLAQAARHTLLLGTGEERAVAATKTYTAQLLALALLSAALGDDPSAWLELADLPDAVQQTLDGNAALDVSAWVDARRCIVLGRGYNLATAREIALKLEETCSLVAHPYSVAEFLHGPVALLEPGLPVIVVAPSGPTSVDFRELWPTLVARGVCPMVISDDDHLLARAELALRLPQGVPEWLSPLPAAVAGQMLAGALAAARGLNPDAPRGLQKVTLTT